MADFFEIDFLDVETDKSGDAIIVRYSINGNLYLHVVDGGYQETGDKIIEHINKYALGHTRIDHVVLTHHDGDHSGGLRTVIEKCNIGCLWMLRPWNYVDDLLPRFRGGYTRDGLVARLKADYPNIHALERIAMQRSIPIKEPFQGISIGAFIVMAPTKKRYIELILNSEKTPELASQLQVGLGTRFATHIGALASKFIYLARSIWGEEVFSSEGTSAENEMSIIQYANLSGQKILLTGDGGREALTEALGYAPFVGINLPGIDRFQVPHHGSRRNLTTEILDKWLGQRLAGPLPEGQEKFQAIISSAKKDADHPRKSVIRACIHRGAMVVTTEGKGIRTSLNAPNRPDWHPIPRESYPEDQEKD